MVEVRIDQVERLTAAGFNGMSKAAPGTTAAEVWSACSSMALCAIQQSKALDMNPEMFRAAVERIWRELPDEVKH